MTPKRHKTNRIRRKSPQGHLQERGVEQGAEDRPQQCVEDRLEFRSKSDQEQPRQDSDEVDPDLPTFQRQAAEGHVQRAGR